MSDATSTKNTGALMLDELRRIHEWTTAAMPWIKLRGKYELHITEWAGIGIMVMGSSVFIHPSIRAQIRAESGMWPINDTDLAALIGWWAEREKAKP